MIRTRHYKLSINPKVKSAVSTLNVFILNILSAADFKTPCQSHILPSGATHAPPDLSYVTYTSIQSF